VCAAQHVHRAGTAAFAERQRGEFADRPGERTLGVDERAERLHRGAGGLVPVRDQLDGADEVPHGRTAVVVIVAQAQGDGQQQVIDAGVVGLGQVGGVRRAADEGVDVLARQCGGVGEQQRQRVVPGLALRGTGEARKPSAHGRAGGVRGWWRRGGPRAWHGSGRGSGRGPGRGVADHGDRVVERVGGRQRIGQERRGRRHGTRRARHRPHALAQLLRRRHGLHHAAQVERGEAATAAEALEHVTQGLREREHGLGGGGDLGVHGGAGEDLAQARGGAVGVGDRGRRTAGHQAGRVEGAHLLDDAAEVQLRGHDPGHGAQHRGQAGAGEGLLQQCDAVLAVGDGAAVDGVADAEQPAGVGRDVAPHGGGGVDQAVRLAAGRDRTLQVGQAGRAAGAGAPVPVGQGLAQLEQRVDPRRARQPGEPVS